MRIFKFGGASVKDADSVRNIAKVLKKEGTEKTLVVISAMGKMTNAFEEIVEAYFYKRKNLAKKLEYCNQYHLKIINDLFNNPTHQIYIEVEELFGLLSGFMAINKSKDYDYIYDQIVSYGELLSTKIVSSYFNNINLNNKWLDVRTIIKTDTNYRDASVNWKLTQQNISTINKDTLIITQGFLGATSKEKTTTLGREGSDFTAAIFAYCLDAKSVTIWKDVDGVLNADPRYFKDAKLLTNISYKEAIEMAFYGASVIHPKTLKPLENKNIPLNVRSFINLKNKGTCVSAGADLKPLLPCFILKQHQILVRISAIDFSFMVEHHISDIFYQLYKHQLKVNSIQNSALSFSVCIEDRFTNFDTFLNKIKRNYKVNVDKDVSLYTIRHFDKKSLSSIEKNKEILLKQVSQQTVQIVSK